MPLQVWYESVSPSLAASLGAEPTQAELDEARDEALRARLRLELGREPTDEEMDAARERELRERLTAKNGGRRPRQEQVEAARREAAKAKLATQLGRDPTDAELRSRGILPPQLTPAAPSDLQLFLMRPKWLPVVQPPSELALNIIYRSRGPVSPTRTKRAAQRSAARRPR